MLKVEAMGTRVTVTWAFYPTTSTHTCLEEDPGALTSPGHAEATQNAARTQPRNHWPAQRQIMIGPFWCTFEAPIFLLAALCCTISLVYVLKQSARVKASALAVSVPPHPPGVARRRFHKLCSVRNHPSKAILVSCTLCSSALINQRSSDH